MTYQQALRQSEKVGAAHAQGPALIAQTCSVLSMVHAINPGLAYNGAIKLGLTEKQLRVMGGIPPVKIEVVLDGKPIDISDIMFVV